ncbi:FKBP-type peptidyl-prolyl cis-trans isomerase [Oceanospirillum beijerinckii]|uniref:FKBP-type peptidyl-prolyl cis-trans isomerase n=1 Tax=Oceanospirillum beijerinckii TaxID=64976 RepID=UPI0004289AD4|nr:FKBP-type peptidyl-prolyl cis-trans isomerase [Oceanospirillum beijerinckii]
MTRFIIIMAAIAVAFFIFKRMSDDRKALEANTREGQAFLASNAQDEGVKTTPSGLQYLVLEEGTGTVHPKPTDRVLVHYHGTLINGKVFDSSVDRGQPIDFGLSQVIAGWTEGLQLMVEGEKTRLYIPSHLAYGKSSVGGIPAGSALVFEVELIKINP